MSTAISSARAAVPRVTSTTSRCHRYASTQTVAVDVPREGRARKVPESFADKMHRKLYPQLYHKADGVNWTPVEPIERTLAESRKRRPKTIAPKWNQVMNKPGVSKHLSRHHGIPVFAPRTPNIKKTCPQPIQTMTALQTSVLDPTGARTRLFDRTNPECARVGDILLVRQRTGDPFAGVCINIRRRGVDTAILLRGQLTRVGVEMWYKVYSPMVEGIEVVERAKKRARRARLTYMRTVKHDRGSVENMVRLYLRQKAALGTVESGKKGVVGGNKAKAMGQGKRGNGRGKKGRR